MRGIRDIVHHTKRPGSCPKDHITSIHLLKEAQIIDSSVTGAGTFAPPPAALGYSPGTCRSLTLMSVLVRCMPGWAWAFATSTSSWGTGPPLMVLPEAGTAAPTSESSKKDAAVDGLPMVPSRFEAVGSRDAPAARTGAGIRVG